MEAPLRSGATQQAKLWNSSPVGWLASLLIASWMIWRMNWSISLVIHEMQTQNTDFFSSLQKIVSKFTAVSCRHSKNRSLSPSTSDGMSPHGFTKRWCERISSLARSRKSRLASDSWPRPQSKRQTRRRSERVLSCEKSSETSLVVRISALAES